MYIYGGDQNTIVNKKTCSKLKKLIVRRGTPKKT